ncbi:MAG TPA: hypothetical protein VFP91_12955 [Vicinamibacterales bacterium]|nr:hypothetical protein [Vicinamibacterales bacterium]
MTMEEKQSNDPAAHKGAIEGDRPSDKQNVEKKGEGVDSQGMPNDPVAQAQDKEGANADGTPG